MAKTMKAAVVHEFGKPLKMEEVPVPVTGYGEDLIKVIANGVCPTDLHSAQGDWPVSHPLHPRHEGARIVAAVGRA
jgi:propanol-preferring alcohol dehydrogenase